MDIVFYGSLKKVKDVNRLLRLFPSVTTEGYIVGSLVEITDPYEPNNIQRYPAFVQEGQNKILAVRMFFDLAEEEEGRFIRDLCHYEGSLFILSTTTFYSINKEPIECKVCAFNTNTITNLTVRSIKNYGHCFDWE